MNMCSLPPSPPKPNHWGALRQFQIPWSIIQDKTLVLSGNALAILAVLHQTARTQQPRSRKEMVTAKVTQKMLSERTGYTKNSITAGLKELANKHFIFWAANERKRGEFTTNEYVICDSKDGTELTSHGRSNFLYANNVQYLNFPTCVAMETPEQWSLAHLTSSEIRLYVCLCLLANRHHNTHITDSAATIRKLTGLSFTTFHEVLGRLETRHLLWTTGDGEFGITLCDPFTGESIHQQTGNAEDDPANYSVTAENGRASRININVGCPEEVEALVLSCLPTDALMEPQRNGDFKICCPFHPDSAPSCSVNPFKRCFYCYSCCKKGTITDLVMKLSGMTKKEDCRMAETSGQVIEFHEPDWTAEKIYNYFDKESRLFKQVLRYPGKRFVQRRPCHGGWDWKVTGLRPILYNLPHLQFAEIVLICEGEKDCDRAMELSLPSADRSCLVATTSGGADSWVDNLADDLVGKRVVLIPDADEAGLRYAEAIRVSLTKREIEHRTVTFNDPSVNDLTDFLEKGGTAADLAERIGSDWMRSSVMECEYVEP